IYTSDKPDQPSLAELSRPQDWGDPRWMYRVYVLEAQGYRNEVHCWLDQHVKEHEHLQTFASLICQIVLPGKPRELCGRDYLNTDDFWSKQWGKQPPYFKNESEDW